IVNAATVGTLLAAATLLITRSPAPASRTVFVLDWLLLVVLVVGSRASFRVFGELLRPRPPSFQRVLIYGAGDGSELLVRELLNNPALQRVPVGFIDDDRGKHHTKIHGLPVFPGGEALEEVLRARAVTELIVSSAKIQGHGLARVAEVCGRL